MMLPQCHTTGRLRGLAMVAALLLALGSSAPRSALADDDCPDDGRRLSLGFDSGAAWSLCVRIDPAHGLTFDDIAYRAPGDRQRPVLRALHPASVLVHEHDLGIQHSLFERARTVDVDRPCAGERETVPTDAIGGVAELCLSRHTTGLLTRFGDIRGRRGAEWRVELAERIDGERWRTHVLFGESGRLTPGMSLAPERARPANDERFSVRLGDGSLAVERSLLMTWRIAPSLDAPADNRVQEFDFTLRPDLGSRRVMAVRTLPFEVLRPVAPERFRGWRLVTAAGAGYYLDSQTQVSGWPGGGGNWTRFALAVTAHDDCERESAATALPPRCGASAPASLDRWVNGESLEGTAPVLWFSQAVLVTAGLDTGMVGARFDLLPFDWTTQSPFESPEVGG